MTIGNLFEKADHVFCHYTLSNGKYDDLLQVLPDFVRDCYISDEQLKSLLEANIDLTLPEILKTKLPDKPTIMSGDFGEMLSIPILEKHTSPAALVIPKKWRYKTAKNKATPYNDVVSWQTGDTPKANDMLITTEVKTRATSFNKNVIEEGLNSLKKNYLQKKAETLGYLRDNAIAEGDLSARKQLDRFIEAIEANNGAYVSRYNVLVVLDVSLLDKIDTDTDLKIELDGELEIILVTTEKLKEMYESVYEKVLSSNTLDAKSN